MGFGVISIGFSSMAATKILCIGVCFKLFGNIGNRYIFKGHESSIVNLFQLFQ